MLKRKIEERLVAQKKLPDRIPLIIKGCRQCGKTFSVLEFARKNYKHIVYLNFFENPNYVSAFKGSLAVDDIIMYISAMLGENAIFKERETVALRV